jgi:hypothetical protein
VVCEEDGKVKHDDLCLLSETEDGFSDPVSSLNRHAHAHAHAVGSRRKARAKDVEKAIAFYFLAWAVFSQNSSLVNS